MDGEGDGFESRCRNLGLAGGAAAIGAARMAHQRGAHLSQLQLRSLGDAVVGLEVAELHGPLLGVGLEPPLLSKGLANLPLDAGRELALKFVQALNLCSVTV